jgi:hypothetical protein
MRVQFVALLLCSVMCVESYVVALFLHSVIVCGDL